MNNEKESSKSKAKKGRKNNASAGLALMHGFSATNVGAARLTVSYLFFGGDINVIAR